MPEQTLLLIDGNSLINRAFFGLLGRHNLTAPDGTPTGALFAFLNMYLRYIDDIRPTHVVTAFDLKAPTFRHDQYDNYKATRKPMPDELAVQMPLLKQLLTSLGVKCMEMTGYEADDLIGTLAMRGKAASFAVSIITGDKDSFQLAEAGVTILQPVTRNGKTETERYDEAAVVARYQITPAQIIDLKAIMGDPSDNIPGVKGIGEKGAIELMVKYGTLDRVYASLDEIRPALADKLRESRDMAYLSQQLATICRTVPITETIDDFVIKPPAVEELSDLLIRLGFKNMIARLNLSPVNSPSSLPDEQSVTCQNSSLQEFSVALQSKPELTALWLEAGQPLYWTVKAGQVFALPGEDIPAAWQMLFAAKCAVACCDYKKILRTTGLPDLDTSLHDVVIAAYLLNQIDGRPDLARIYQQATGLSLPEAADNDSEAVNAKSKPLPVQTDLFTLSEHAVPEANVNIITSIKPGQDFLAHAVREIALQQQTQIQARGIEKLVYEIEMPLAGILAAMETRGFSIDLTVLDQLATEMDRTLETLQISIFEQCGRSFNLNSPKQLADILYQDLGLASGKKRSSGSFSTDSEELERLALEHPVIPLIIEHRQVAKLRSTYVEGLKKVRDPADGRVHTTFNQTLTATGRLSSTDPNLQNIPIRMAAGQKIRRAFIAAPGHVLLDADYSQIELRILAHLSGDKAMIDAFVNNEDIHTNTACRIFDTTADRITPEQRSVAKTMNFSIVYGISDFGLARDLGVTIRQAHQYIADYEALYPDVRRYLKELVEQAYAHGYVETMTGRRRYMPELKSPNRNLRQFGERAAMNTPVQGTAADMIKIAMVSAAAGLRAAGLKSELILQVHDELIVEAHLDEIEQASAILKSAMQNAMQLQVPLLAEVRQGASWADCK